MVKGNTERGWNENVKMLPNFTDEAILHWKRAADATVEQALGSK
jgi:hypothetical protein